MTSDPPTCTTAWYDGGSTFMAYYNGTTGFGNDVGAGASYLAQQFNKIVDYDPPVRDGLRWKYDYFWGQQFAVILKGLHFSFVVLFIVLIKFISLFSTFGRFKTLSLYLLLNCVHSVIHWLTLDKRCNL